MGFKTNGVRLDYYANCAGAIYERGFGQGDKKGMHGPYQPQIEALVEKLDSLVGETVSVTELEDGKGNVYGKKYCFTNGRRGWIVHKTEQPSLSLQGRGVGDLSILTLFTLPELGFPNFPICRDQIIQI